MCAGAEPTRVKNLANKVMDEAAKREMLFGHADCQETENTKRVTCNEGGVVAKEAVRVVRCRV
jgi:hypothetical protein